MNLSHAVFLVNKGARAVKGIYEPSGTMDHNDVYVNPKGQKIANAVFKTLDKSIKVGDLCVVPTGTRHGFTVIKVTEVDVDLDFEDKTPVEWIVSRVNVDEYKNLLSEESKLTDEIRKKEFAVRRSQLMDALNMGGD